MSSAQVWIAIPLGFIVLITLIGKLRHGPSEHRVRESLAELSGRQHTIEENLLAIRADLAEMHAQLASLHRILEQVE